MLEASMPELDAVISWVDGNDPKHLRKRAQFSEDAAKAHPKGLLPTRFQQVGEIYFCIASILKFCPDVRTIWLVTDDQTPEFLGDFVKEGLCPPGKIRIIDHKDIFAGHENCLPTFNSRSIEVMLHRISGLAEKYIFLNDDFFLTREVTVEDFFKDGKPVIHADYVLQHRKSFKVRWRRFLRKITFRKQREKTNTHICASISAQLVGEKTYTVNPRHQPHPLRVSTQRNFYERHPEILRAQMKFRFRNHTQFQVAALAYLLELRADPALTIHNERVHYEVDCGCGEGADKIRANMEPAVKFLCVQSLDCAAEDDRAAVIDWLVERVGSHCPAAVLRQNGRAPDDIRTAALHRESA
ncbi:stealth family protein [Thioclava kandeliae]|uniref:Stealth CR1 domain-containing protein n=1 Tax=Thioclava kandeliae TaxID=3070818 RepID=A0ABV1SCQ2_9RHOB